MKTKQLSTSLKIFKKNQMYQGLRCNNMIIDKNKIL